MGETSIEWTDVTWNPTRGCSLASPGCTNCYAMKLAHRFSAPGGTYAGLTRMTGHGPVWTGDVRLIHDALRAPLRWRKPRRVFVNSMSDLFHEKLSNEEIASVFGVMAVCPQHTFQVLTKRAERMREWFEWIAARAIDDGGPWTTCLRETVNSLPEALGLKLIEDGIARDGVPDREPWPLPNVWLGVSVENQEYADRRIPDLLATPAAVRFLSIEPQLGPVNLHAALCTHGSLDGAFPEHRWCAPICAPRGELHWVIVGGESGPGARPFRVEWMRSLVQQCREAGVPVFCKQLGARAVEGEPLGSFTSFAQWANKAKSWLGGTGAVVFDAKGRHLVRGADFHRARDEDAFPVRYHLPLALEHSKGGDMTQWPEDLRVREFPRDANGGT